MMSRFERNRDEYLKDISELTNHQNGRRDYALAIGMEIAFLLEEGCRIYVDESGYDKGFLSAFSLTYEKRDPRYGGVCIRYTVGDIPPFPYGGGDHANFVKFEDDPEYDHGIHSSKKDLRYAFECWNIIPPKGWKRLFSKI